MSEKFRKEKSWESVLSSKMKGPISRTKKHLLLGHHPQLWGLYFILFYLNELSCFTLKNNNNNNNKKKKNKEAVRAL
jgi:hypothetical protein